MLYVRGAKLIVHIVICAGAICIGLTSSSVIAQSNGAQNTAAGQTAAYNNQTRWRAGDVIVTESTADADGWITLDCEGADIACMPLLKDIQSSIEPKEQRRVGGHFQVLAVTWVEIRVKPKGPLRALDRAPLSPWIDARYLRCIGCNDSLGALLIAAHTSDGGHRRWHAKALDYSLGAEMPRVAAPSMVEGVT